MNLDLSGKRALVTGSSGGIGAGIAGALARQGAHVVVHGRNRAEVAAVAAAIGRDGGTAQALVADLRDEAALAAMTAQLLADGGVDVLVNNAGQYVNRDWWQARPADWLALYAANVTPAVHLTQALVPAMRARGWGRIIQVASGEATQPLAFMPDYAASKAALVNLTVSLSKALAGTGITANTVSPGLIATAGVQAFYRHMAAEQGWGTAWEQIEQHVLRAVLPNNSGRLGWVEDVADLVAFVASPSAGYINGANLRVDGGSTRCIN
ncbi:SDR family NAD(P)-dependent oxidoreductase [Hymenobacter sp.]|uniref:SDR family NAD(P)-dependent oxidoreductase n=1 Tax=Hymenobacter sp. TaxID=1898978 RepID=UPI00286D12BE|nr:SDR family NAD(P)-dependent oxidoreductase [Hymenobacter sp.]